MRTLRLRRTVATAIVSAVLVSVFTTIGFVATARPAAAEPPAGGTTVIDETFSGATVPDPDWQAQGITCLTGAPVGSTPSPSVRNCSTAQVGAVPAIGAQPGYLQLTDARGNAAGTLLFNRPVPASAGVSVVFEQYQYGGNGADGIGFFLVDGATNLTATGGLGGSLGYAQRNNEPGVAGGYVGIGLDAYGNFYDDAEGRGNNCPVGEQSPSRKGGAVAPNVVTIRGPGSGINGYCWQASTVTPGSNPDNPTSTLPGSLRGSSLATAKRLVNVQVTPAPDPQIIVEIDFTGTGNNWQRVLTRAAPPNPPSTYKLGFAASTGGSNDIHLIRNVTVKTINDLPDLSLTKQVDRTAAPLPAVITAGTVIPYQYLVTNTGVNPLDITGITDSKGVPVSCPTTTLPPLPDPNNATTCTGTYTVTASDVTTGSVTNTATAAAVTPGGATVQSNPSTVTVPLTSALALTKSVVTAPPYVTGQQVQYSYTLTNTGGSVLSTVAVSDNRVARGGVVCSATTLDPADTATCTATTTIQANQLSALGTLTNTAQASAVTPIGQPVTSNQAQATIGVNTDVGVTKVVNNATPAVGDQVTYTVTATNYGPGVASALVVTDLLPSGLTFTSSTPGPPPAGTPAAPGYTPTNGRWAIGTLPVNGTATLSLTATVSRAGALTNAATRTGMAQVDTNPANDSASVTLNAVTPTLDIAVTKNADVASVRVGQQATFTITATNKGPFAGDNVVLADVLPSLLSYVTSAASVGTYDAASGTWTVGALAVNQTVTLTITVQATAVGTFTNTASLSSVTPQDTNQANDIDTATLLVTAPQADLALTKAVFLTGPVAVNDVVTYEVDVENKGPDRVTDAVVTDTHVAGLTVVGATPSQGTVDVPTLTWSVGTLEVGGTAKILVRARVDTPGTKQNSATVSSATVPDPDPTNNTDSAVFGASAQQTDIAVTKTRDGPAVVTQGSTVTFTVQATNDGPVTATNVVVGDPLPDGLTLLSADPAAQYDAADGAWSVGTVLPGATATLSLVAVAATPGLYVNTASLRSLDQIDTNPDNNTDFAGLAVVVLADLAITKSVTPTVSQPGQPVVYTVTVTNLGPNPTDSVEAKDPLPIVADITGSNPSQGTFDADSRVWTIGTLSPGQTVTLTVNVLPLPSVTGSFLNTVVIAQSSTPDPNLLNNIARATLEIPAADLAVTKTVDNPNPEAADTVTFTVTAQNLGPDPTTTAQVLDPLPSGLAYTDSTASVGDYDPTTGIWTIGALNVGDPPETLTITAAVTSTGTTVNQATVSSTFPVDIDPTNNTASATITATPQAADVAITKTVSVAQAIVQSQVTYTLRVTNLGPGTATNTVVTDTVPDGLTILTTTPDTCSTAGQTVTCAVGDLPVNGAVDVAVIVRATTAGDFPNTATVSATPRDPAPSNNTATIGLQVVVPTTPPVTTPPGGSGAPGTSLGYTGYELAPPLGAAAVLTGLGLQCLLLGRRRKQHNTTPGC